MNLTKLVIYLLIILLSTACSDSKKEIDQRASYGAATIDAKEIEQDFMKWWSYFNKQIILSEDFVALDSSLLEISKGAFLELLKTGDFMPLKLNSKDGTTYLKLYALTENVGESIVSTIQATATNAFEQYKMEGTTFPAFNFKDLEGEVFTNENTKNKFVILKCWFIACKACVAEFPELNELVDKHKDRNDIEFISLAFDAEDALKRFMQKKEFDYSVVPVDRSFLQNDMKVTQYPTHFIIDQKGVIKKVVNNFKELEMALAKEL